MSVYLLDTNAVSDLARGEPNITGRSNRCADPVVINTIGRGELLYGLARLPKGKRQVQFSQRVMQILAGLPCQPITEPIADVYADLNPIWKAAASRCQTTIFGLPPRPSRWAQSWSRGTRGSLVFFDSKSKTGRSKAQ